MTEQFQKDVDHNEHQNLQREAAYLYEDTQKLQATTCQQSEIIEGLQERVRELENCKAFLQKENLALREKTTYIVQENTSFKQKLSDNMTVNRCKEAAFAELAKRREEIDVLQKLTNELTESVNAYRYQTECLTQENHYLTLKNDNLAMLQMTERKARHDLEYQLSFGTRINEMLDNSRKSEKNRRLNLERKLNLLSSESPEVKTEVSKRFSLVPSPVLSCIRCRACLSKLDETANVCRYHSHRPVSYPGWKNFEPSLSPHTNRLHHKYWPCCDYFGVIEPTGCQEEITHIFEP